MGNTPSNRTQRGVLKTNKYGKSCYEYKVFGINIQLPLDQMFRKLTCQTDTMIKHYMDTHGIIRRISEYWNYKNYSIIRGNLRKNMKIGKKKRKKRMNDLKKHEESYGVPSLSELCLKDIPSEYNDCVPFDLQERHREICNIRDTLDNYSGSDVRCYYMHKHFVEKFPNINLNLYQDIRCLANFIIECKACKARKFQDLVRVK